MRIVGAAILVAALAVCGRAGAQPASTPKPAGTLHVFAGVKFLDGDDWGDTDEQPEIGVGFTLGAAGSSTFALAIDASFSGDNAEATLLPGLPGLRAELRSRTIELRPGLRLVTRTPRAIAYFGGGPAGVWG